MTLDKLYELVIHQLIYGMLRVDSATVFDYDYSYYGVTHSSIGTVILEYNGTSYVFKTPETNILITKYENSHKY